MPFLKRNFLVFTVSIVVSLLFLCFSSFSCSLAGSNFTGGSEKNDVQAELANLQSEYDNLMEKYEKQKDAYTAILRENEKLTDEVADTDEEIEKMDSEIADLKEKLTGTESGAYIEEIELKIERLKELLDNINLLLRHVYTGSSDPEEINYTFTAFSIQYNKKYYIVTAGHCIADNFGNDGRFKFRANFSDDWIYPELMGYKAEFWNLDDYAVFYSEGINAGLAVSDVETEDNYLPGSLDKGLSVFRNLGDSSKRGESGSPVINEYGEVIGIYVVYGLVYTPIELVLELIDSYEQN